MKDELASGSEDGTLKVWTEGQDGIEEMSHRSEVTCMDWSVGGDLLATGCKEGEAAVWKGNSQVATLKGHTDWIFKIKFNDSGELVATASYDETFRVWQAATGQLVKKVDCVSRIFSLVWIDEENIITGC